MPLPVRLWHAILVGSGMRAGEFAEALIEGSNVVVSSPQVSNPVAVRYAWADDPVCNLINQDGFPASPFRSDEPHYAW